MNTPVVKGIGNSVAPWRFIMFFCLMVVVGIVVYPFVNAWQKSVMYAFVTAALFFLISLWPVINDGSKASIRRRAAQNDANRGLLLVLAAVIVAVLLVTIAMELSGAQKPPALLIIATLILAWLFSNTVYALHYAHLYHGLDSGGAGIVFPGKSTPDYWDFLYFAFTLGMTFQTSDVVITSPGIRRVALAQSIASFMFNIGVLAFTINILGS
jgi:uncharacterized membrane protein